MMVTEHGSGRTWWAMKKWEREVRGQGKDGAGGRRSVTKPIPLTKLMGMGRHNK
jgi:hypothetical protein